jgi:hypothetical protein
LLDRDRPSPSISSTERREDKREDARESWRKLWSSILDPAANFEAKRRTAGGWRYVGFKKGVRSASSSSDKVVRSSKDDVIVPG